jgi:hypothetical protein
MANTNPSPTTRFKPGRSGNPNGTSGPHRATILRALPAVRSLEEIQADVRAWKGSPRQMFESIARDPDHPLDLRMHAAAVLLKHDDEQAEPLLTPEQRRRRIADLMRELGPPQIESTAEAAPEASGV